MGPQSKKLSNESEGKVSYRSLESAPPRAGSPHPFGPALLHDQGCPSGLSGLASVAKIAIFRSSSCWVSHNDRIGFGRLLRVGSTGTRSFLLPIGPVADGKQVRAESALSNARCRNQSKRSRPMPTPD